MHISATKTKKPITAHACNAHTIAAFANKAVFVISVSLCMVCFTGSYPKTYFLEMQVIFTKNFFKFSKRIYKSLINNVCIRTHIV